MENKILPSAGSHDLESFPMPSRKRKLRTSSLPEATSEFHLPWVSSLNPDCLFHGVSKQGDSHASSTNDTVLSESPTFHCSDGFSDACLNGNVNVHVNGFGSMSNLPLNLATQSAQHEGQPPQIDVSYGGKIEVLNCIKEECPYTQAETHKRLSFIETSAPGSVKSQLSPRLDDVVSSLLKIDDISGKPPLELHNRSSELLIPISTSEQKFSQPKNSADGFLGRACSGGASNPENSSELNRPGQFLGNEVISNQPSGLDSMTRPSYAEEKEKQCSISNEVQHSIGVSVGNISQKGDHGRSNSHLNEPESADKEQRHHSLTGKVSNAGSVLATSDRQYCSSGLYHKFDEKGLHSWKSASVGSEKLWDGSLQLNSSFTMSAVAFFRSGERLVDINWSKSVEVKGRVRLDVFEKYIHDLPRSRTRGMMVMSVCAKEGSSDKDLKRMKEVAKGYRTEEKLGLANLSHGVNLYLCPRSDKIFTVLAKYGFLKGMTAIQGKSDSFIGCVVWRKNQTIASFVANKKHSDSSSKESKSSPSDSSTTKESVERSMSATQPAHNSISQAMHLSAVESIRVADKKVVIGNSACADLSMLPSVPASSSVRVVQQVSGHLNLSSQISKGHPLQREASSDGFSVSALAIANIELPKMPITVLPCVMKQMPSTADDDLPEYDFGTVCGIALMSDAMPIDVPITGRVQTEKIKIVDGAVLPCMPGTYSVSASNCRTDNASNLRLSTNVNQGMPLPRRVTDQEPQFHVSGTFDDQHGFRKYATRTANATLYISERIHSDNPSKSTLFSDNIDDMPEWLPPQYQVPTLVDRHKPSSAAMHSELSPATFQNQQFPRRPPFHSPFSAAIRPEKIPPYPRLPPAMPSKNAPSSLTGFQRNPVLRPSLG